MLFEIISCRFPRRILGKWLTMRLHPERLGRAVYSTGGLTLEFEKALSADEFEILSQDY
jgi:hypothetical protein